MSKQKSEKKKKKSKKKDSMTEQEIAEKTEEFLIKQGDFVIIDSTSKVKSSGKLLDTSDEEVARSENAYDEKKVYGPRLIIVGKGWELKGVDELLEKMVVGVSKTITIPPSDAFGEKDAKNIKTYSIREVQRTLQKGQKARLGTIVTIDGKRGFIRHISQGRVRVDFNHPLAGEAITYDVKVVKKITDEKEMILELMRRRIPKIDADKFNIIKDDKILTIDLPKEVYFDQNLPIAKIGISSEIQQYIPNIETVRFVETYGKELFQPIHAHDHDHDHDHNH